MTNHLEDLKEIRQLMERSSKFLSLSGLSGIAVGLVALISSGIIYFHEDIFGFYRGEQPNRFELLIGYQMAITFIVAITLAIIFTSRKAEKRGEPFWNPLSRKVFFALGIPLAVGGVVVLKLYDSGIIIPLAGLTLIFYGLALLNTSYYTYKDLYYLGLFEIGLGLLAIFWAGHALLLWALGFGVLHIVYGARMYFKYEK